MQAKFYKGPWHNKTRWIADGQNFITLASMSGSALVDRFDSNIYASVPTIQHMYRRTHHTHPDGSVFFVYEGKS